jgi:hypothetical protein
MEGNYMNSKKYVNLGSPDKATIRKRKHEVAKCKAALREVLRMCKSLESKTAHFAKRMKDVRETCNILIEADVLKEKTKGNGHDKDTIIVDMRQKKELLN